MDLLMQLCEKFGPYVALMFFFVWRDFRREERLETKIGELNSFITTTLIDMVEKTTEALNRHVR